MEPNYRNLINVVGWALFVLTCLCIALLLRVVYTGEWSVSHTVNLDRNARITVQVEGGHEIKTFLQAATVVMAEQGKGDRDVVGGLRALTDKVQDLSEGLKKPVPPAPPLPNPATQPKSENAESPGRNAEARNETQHLPDMPAMGPIALDVYFVNLLVLRDDGVPRVVYQDVKEDSLRYFPDGATFTDPRTAKTVTIKGRVFVTERFLLSDKGSSVYLHERVDGSERVREIPASGVFHNRDNPAEIFELQVQMLVSKPAQEFLLTPVKHQVSPDYKVKSPGATNAPASSQPANVRKVPIRPDTSPGPLPPATMSSN